MLRVDYNGNVFQAVYDGDDDAGDGDDVSAAAAAAAASAAAAAGDDNAAATAAAAAAAAAANPNKTYSQKELDEIVKRERKAFENRTKKTVEDLEKLKKSKNLTEQEKTDLQKKIEELNETLLTKEQLAQRERDRMSKQHKSELDNATKERDSWRERFNNSTILRAITDAAVAEDAFNPQHIIAILRQDSRLVEELDNEGNPTGNFVAKVKFKDGSDTLDLTIPEAVKRMRDLPESYGNLFKSTLNGGLGLEGGSGKRTNVDVRKMTPEQYRKNGRSRLGLTPSNKKG